MHYLALILVCVSNLASGQEPIVQSAMNILKHFNAREIATEEKTVFLDDGNVKAVYRSSISISDIELVNGVLKYQLSYANKQTNYDIEDGQEVGEPIIKDRTGRKDCQISGTFMSFSVGRGFCVISNNSDEGVPQIAETFGVKMTSNGMLLKHSQSMLTNFFATNDTSVLGTTMITETFIVNQYDDDGEVLKTPEISMRHAFDAYSVDPLTLDRMESTKKSDLIEYEGLDS